MRVKAACIMAGALLCTVLFAGADPGPKVHNNIKTVNHAFGPGEKLTYSISWSKVLEAGIAEMEVREGRTPDGKHAYDLLSQTHSVGMVDKVYPVRDTVESIVDASDICSVAFKLRESHGRKKRERDMLFDRAGSSVKVTVNGAGQHYPVPERVQDALSSLYYVRTRQDLIVGKSIVVDVHDSGKTWAVEVQTLGKERISTPAGEFDTIMVKTFPKYEGVFMNKGEIAIWLTDDVRRVPVLMKSKLSIGSIVATLISRQDGTVKP
jgi:uncharacterized protein DUF3108